MIGSVQVDSLCPTPIRPHLKHNSETFSFLICNVLPKCPYLETLGKRSMEVDLIWTHILANFPLGKRFRSLPILFPTCFKNSMGKCSSRIQTAVDVTLTKSASHA